MYTIRTCLYDTIYWVNLQENEKYLFYRERQMFIHTRGSAPKRMAKFGRQTRTFCYKRKWKKRSAKLESIVDLKGLPTRPSGLMHAY